MPAVLILTTASSAEEARRIAQALVERRLAACVNIVAPVKSVYRWQEKIETAAESLLLIKTVQARFPLVRDTIKELHSYDVPECICLPVTAGSQAYLDWIAASVQP